MAFDLIMTSLALLNSLRISVVCWAANGPIRSVLQENNTLQDLGLSVVRVVFAKTGKT